jgi:hypothetical protein
VTLERWQAVKAGDVLIDHHASDARREVFRIRRVSGTRGQRPDDVRVCLVCTNLKSTKSSTTLFTSDNLGPHRFDIAEDP